MRWVRAASKSARLRCEAALRRGAQDKPLQRQRRSSRNGGGKGDGVPPSRTTREWGRRNVEAKAGAASSAPTEGTRRPEGPPLRRRRRDDGEECRSGATALRREEGTHVKARLEIADLRFEMGKARGQRRPPEMRRGPSPRHSGQATTQATDEPHGNKR